MKTPKQIMDELQKNSLVLSSVPHGIKYEAYVSTMAFFYKLLKQDCSFPEWRDDGIMDAIVFIISEYFKKND